jgi:GDP-D-mannose dehydratase
MAGPIDSRRFLQLAAQRFVAAATRTPVEEAPVEPSRLTIRALEAIRMSRSRDRILANLDEMYREAFDRAKATGDQAQMTTLDFAYRREQLYFEILLDVRDAVERR